MCFLVPMPPFLTLESTLFANMWSSGFENLEGMVKVSQTENDTRLA